MGSIWHIGIAVPDLEKGKKELGEVFGLRWRPARVRKLTLADAAGQSYEVECHVVFSLGGPFAVEVWQAIPGTPLDMPQAGGIHHIGYWVDDIAAEAKRLDALGHPSYATAGPTPLLNRGPAGPSSNSAACTATARRCATCSRPGPSSPVSRSPAPPCDARAGKTAPHAA